MRPKGEKQYYQKVQKTIHFVHLYITFIGQHFNRCSFFHTTKVQDLTLNLICSESAANIESFPLPLLLMEVLLK